MAEGRAGGITDGSDSKDSVPEKACVLMAPAELGVGVGGTEEQYIAKGSSVAATRGVGAWSTGDW